MKDISNKDHPLLNVKWGVIPITVYRGVLVEKLIGGYRVFGYVVSTPSDVDDKINSASISLQNSLK
jgi:hypothetical protein